MTVRGVIKPRGGSKDGPPTEAEVSASRHLIEAELLKRVEGQGPAIRQLSLLLHMHLAALQSTDPLAKVPNLVIHGESGVGKTLAVKTASRLLGLPFAVVDATTLVTAGTVGAQAEDCLEQLAQDAAEIERERVGGARPVGTDAILRAAERGIVVFDEFDKLATGGDGGYYDAHAKNVQRSLLTMTSGARLRVGVKRHGSDMEERWMDTSRILFVACGTFDGCVRRTTTGALQLSSADLLSGFLPETVGRFPVLVPFVPLSVDALGSIVGHPTGSPLAPWRHYFRSVLGVELRIDQAAARVVAERALALGLGARGLQQVLFPVLARLAADTDRASRAPVMTVTVADVMPIAGAVSTSVVN